MKKILGISAIGLVAVGLFFGRSIGNYIIDKLDNKDTRVNNGLAYADQYIANCDTLKIAMKNFKDSIGSFKVQGSGGNQAIVNTERLLFYSNEYKKYFCIMYFFNKPYYDDYFSSLVSQMDQKAENIAGIINKQELTSPIYGTRQKPIPILYFTFQDKRRNTIYDYTQKGEKVFQGNENQFKTWMLRYNVGHYLSYVKSKIDFEKMFGKQAKP